MGEAQLLLGPSEEEGRLVDTVMATHGAGTGDIHATFAELRKRGPVYQGDVIRLMGGQSALSVRSGDFPHFSVVRYEAAAQVLREYGTFGSAALNETLARSYGRTILTMDPPDHRKSRVVLQQIFSKRALDEWRRKLFRPVIEAYVERLLPRGGCDLYRECYLQFPVTILYQLMGLTSDPEAAERFHLLALKLLLVRSARPEVAMEAAAELYDDLMALIAQRRREVAEGRAGDDIVAKLVAANDAADAMTDDELACFLRLLLPAGAETTTKATGNLTVAVLRDRTQWDALLADRALISNAVDEGLRWDGATVSVYRVAMKDTEVAGTPLPEGSGVTVAVGSANRDEAQFANPDAFDVHRAPGTQLGFGHGIHLCLGHQMARMEMAEVLDVLLDRMPNLRLEPNVDPPEVTGLTFRAPTHLKVRWD